MPLTPPRTGAGCGVLQQVFALYQHSRFPQLDAGTYRMDQPGQEIHLLVAFYHFDMYNSHFETEASWISEAARYASQ